MRHLLVVAFIGLVAADEVASGSPSANHTARAAADGASGRERGKVYRFDPLSLSFESVAATEIRPGHIYSRFDPTGERWVWSKADASGRLHYAMGPGSVQPARMFDLRGTDAERQRVLEERAPELARLLKIQGARPMLRLNDQKHWEVGPTPSVSSVFDMNTGERWEWHADEPSRVVHPGGIRWTRVNGRYAPAP